MESRSSRKAPARRVVSRKASAKKRSSPSASPPASSPSTNGPGATPRKGARRRSEVPAAVLEGLNNGTLETANLVEFLAMDLLQLASAVSPNLGRAAEKRIAPEMGTLARMKAIGELVAAGSSSAEVRRLARHTSDTVRGWAAYALASIPDLPLEKRLLGFRPLADDSHFGVREWAWLALRPHIASDIEHAVELLTRWVPSSAVGIRRFAVEITRPRGVWCAHIEMLKATPEIGLPLLSPLREEPHKYVQDSVANWLNDASKTAPEWVRKVCNSWRRSSSSPATSRICQRALRSLEKKT